MATFLNYPFDPELFLYKWGKMKDTTTEAMLDSGAVVRDAEIERLISNGSDLYTLPLYGLMGLTDANAPVNYDGMTDIDTTSPEGVSMTGIVYGRAKGFLAKDFIADFNSGADQMEHILSKVDKYWKMYDQKVLLGILAGVFGITGNAGWTDHTLNLATTGSSVGEANVMGEHTVSDAIQKAVGDFGSQFSLAIMHSTVANTLAKKERLEYRKYTDAMGIQRQINVADVDGLTVIVDDGVPVKDSASATGNKEYTTYLFGAGAIRTANAPVDRPVSTSRDEAKNGGQETLWTRKRKTFLPYGFTFNKPTSGYTSSPTDAQLFATANWGIIENAKNIPMARVITNG